MTTKYARVPFDDHLLLVILAVHGLMDAIKAWNAR